MNSGLFRYLGCGLDNVYLKNGYTIRKSASGEDLVRIEDIDGLHNAIAKSIVSSPSPLDAKEFKFLRKELDMSQKRLAETLGLSEQTVSLWERGEGSIPQSAEIILRGVTKEKLSGNAELMRVIDTLNALDRSSVKIDDEEGVALQHDESGAWERMAA